MTSEEAFDRYHQAVFRFAYRLTLSAEIAEDITQECFLSFLRAPGRYDRERGTAKTFLFSIARNLVLKRCRDDRTPVPLDEGIEVWASNATPAPELSLAVAQAVAALPSLQQEAVVLFEYEGFTLEEIAAVAGVDPGTIKSRLHRARERLKRVLAPYRRLGGVHEAV